MPANWAQSMRGGSRSAVHWKIHIWRQLRWWWMMMWWHEIARERKKNESMLNFAHVLSLNLTSSSSSLPPPPSPHVRYNGDGGDITTRFRGCVLGGAMFSNARKNTLRNCVRVCVCVCVPEHLFKYANQHADIVYLNIYNSQKIRRLNLSACHGAHVWHVCVRVSVRNLCAYCVCLCEAGKNKNRHIVPTSTPA